MAQLNQSVHSIVVIDSQEYRLTLREVAAGEWTAVVTRVTQTASYRLQYTILPGPLTPSASADDAWLEGCQRALSDYTGTS